MALPLPYRPKAVIELQEEERAAEERESLKFKISKPHCFLEAMKIWYGNLKKQQKNSLTRRLLMNRAVYQASILKLRYDHLPKNWIGQLKKDCGLILYMKRSKLEKLNRLKEQQRTGRHPDSDSDSDNPPRISNSKSNPSETGEQAGSSQAPKRKKLVDLTGNPPPDFWIKARAKGIILPRYQTFYSTSKETYMYYDYNPKRWKPVDKSLDLSNMVIFQHEGNVFDWFSEYAKSESDAISEVVTASNGDLSKSDVHRIITEDEDKERECEEAYQRRKKIREEAAAAAAEAEVDSCELNSI